MIEEAPLFGKIREEETNDMYYFEVVLKAVKLLGEFDVLQPLVFL